MGQRMLTNHSNFQSTWWVYQLHWASSHHSRTHCRYWSTYPQAAQQISRTSFSKIWKLTNVNSQIQCRYTLAPVSSYHVFGSGRQRYRGMMYNEGRGIRLLAHDPRDTSVETLCHAGSPPHIPLSSLSIGSINVSILILNLCREVQNFHPNLSIQLYELVAFIKIAESPLYLPLSNSRLTSLIPSNLNFQAKGVLDLFVTWAKMIGPPCWAKSSCCFMSDTTTETKLCISACKNHTPWLHWGSLVL